MWRVTGARTKSPHEASTPQKYLGGTQGDDAAWADYLDTITSGKVVAKKFGKVAQIRGTISRDLAQQTRCNHAYQLHVFQMQ
jgi:hypothetical protein